jgi:hypothetical protein
MDKKGKHRVRHEKRDVNLIAVAGIAVIMIVVFIVVLVLLTDYFIKSKEEIVHEKQLKPESVDLKSILTEENEILSTYELLDPAKKIYRIPIKRAMQILAEESTNNN